MKKHMTKLYLIIIGIIFFNSATLSKTIFVPTSPKHLTIEAALADAKSGDIVEVNPTAQYNPYTPIIPIVVPTGVTLKLKAGVTVHFLYNCTIDGCLETQGTSYLKVYLNFGHNLGLGCYGKLNCTHTIFANYSLGSTWDGIMLMGEGTSRTNGSILDNCIITGVHYSYNGSGAALWILGSDNVTVRYCTISNIFKFIKTNCKIIERDL